MRVENKDGKTLRSMGSKISLKATGMRADLQRQPKPVTFIFLKRVKAGPHSFEKDDIVTFTKDDNHSYQLNDDEDPKTNSIQGFFRRWKKRKLLVPYTEDKDNE